MIRPIPKSTKEYETLHEACEEFLDALETHRKLVQRHGPIVWDRGEDYQQAIFEAAISAVYGSEILPWLDEQIETFESTKSNNEDEPGSE